MHLQCLKMRHPNGYVGTVQDPLWDGYADANGSSSGGTHFNGVLGQWWLLMAAAALAPGPEGR